MRNAPVKWWSSAAAPWLCGFVVYNGCLTGWWALALTLCFLLLPVFSSLQAVGVNSPPSLSSPLNAAFPSPCSSRLRRGAFAFHDCKFDGPSEGNQTISSIRRPTQTHVWTFSFFSSFSRRHLCSRAENTLFTPKAEKNLLTLKNKKQRQPFKADLHLEEGLPPPPCTSNDPSVCVKLCTVDNDARIEAKTEKCWD